MGSADMVLRSGPYDAGGGRREAVADALHRLAPALPPFESTVVTDRALDSRGLGTARPEEAAWLALVAYARHALTDYDELLADGYNAESARFFVLDDINAALAHWGARRRVSGDEPP